MEPIKNKQNLLGAGAILALLLSVYVIVLSTKEWKSLKYIGGENSQSFITVTGEADAVAVPDIATFSYSVTTLAKTVNEARDQSTIITNKALEVLKKASVDEKDIKTTAYSISPKYEYSYGTQYIPAKQVFTGYEVNQTIEVKVRDLNKVGQLFADVSTVGVKNIGGITFAVESKELLKQEARTKAINKAKKQAEDLADELGVRLVRISNFQESGSVPYPVYYAKGGMMMDAAAAPAPSIPAGEEKITSTVTITYEIR